MKYDRLTVLITMNVIIWIITVKTLSSSLHHCYHPSMSFTSLSLLSPSLPSSLSCTQKYYCHAVKLMKVAKSNYPSCMRVYQCESDVYDIIGLIVTVIHIWSFAYNCTSTAMWYNLLIIHRISNKSHIKNWTFLQVEPYIC